MANTNKARHAFGNSENLQKALDEEIIDPYDILFLDGDTEPKVGWVDKNGEIKVVSNKTDLSGVEAELATKANSKDVETLESQIATKADASEVEALQTEIATKADVATVQTMINEAAVGVIEVVEF